MLLVREFQILNSALSATVPLDPSFDPFGLLCRWMSFNGPELEIIWWLDDLDACTKCTRRHKSSQAVGFDRRAGGSFLAGQFRTGSADLSARLSKVRSEGGCGGHPLEDSPSKPTTCKK